MLKPTVNKEYCWHVSASICNRPPAPTAHAESSTAVAGPHTDYHPSLTGFDDAYYDRLSQLIDKHLALGTDDRVCYVGDAHGGHVVPVLTDQYCLVRPVVRVDPYSPSTDDNSQQMDEVFCYQPSGLKSDSYFDKIIIYNSIHLFPDITAALLRFVNALTDRGRLLLIHRPIRLNTLPFPAHIVERLRSTDLSLEYLISTIQSLGLEFCWEVEHSRVVTSRRKWLDMIQCGGFPPCKQHHETQPVNITDNTQTATASDGVHELMTGILRYAGDSDIEFVDRMVFLTVSRASPVPAIKDPATVSRNHKASSKVPTYGSLEMEVTTDITELLNAKSRQQHKKRNLFD